MPQITFVSDQHNDDISISMIPQLLQPSCNVLIGLMLADVINKKSSDCAPVVGRCDSTISFLACGIPNLRLDCLLIDLNGSGCKFHTDGGFRVKTEFVASETTQEIGFTNTRVSDQDDYKELD